MKGAKQGDYQYSKEKSSKGDVRKGPFGSVILKTPPEEERVESRTLTPLFFANFAVVFMESTFTFSVV
jgi:hypothetical protein